MMSVCFQLKEIRLFLKSLIALIFLTSSSYSWAHQFQKDNININHPHIKFVISSGPAAGYMKIVNMGDDIDRLLSIEVNFADAELYHSEIVGGLTKMKQVKHIEIPPQKAKSLKPGSHHIVFSNLSIELIKGISLEGVMIFEKAGRITVEFEVESQQTTNDHTDY